MPTYDNICLSCGKRFEHFQKINESPISECPDCGGTTKRLITGGSGFIMKNGGSSSGEFMKPACGRDTTCCGSDHACGKSNGCGHHS